MRRFGVLCTRVIAIAIIATLSTGCMHAYERGQNALLQNDYNSAQQFARQGLDENKNHPESNLLMAQVLSAQKRFGDALPYAQKAIQAKHLQADAGRTLGKIYWELGRALEAVETWKIARAADSNSVRDDDFQRALEAALALAVSRRDAEATLQIRTDLHTLNQNHPEATHELLHASREDLARTRIQQGRLEDAIALYTDLLTEQSEPEKNATYNLELGTLLVRMERHEEASKAWQQAVAQAPAAKKEETLFEIARRAESLGEAPLAAQFLQVALADMQKDVSTYRRATLQLQIARLAMRTNDQPGAQKHLRAYLDDMREIRGTPLDGEVYRTAANVALENEYPELAIELLEEASEQAQPTWNVAMTLAELYARRGRTQDVERILTRFSERAPNPAEAEANAARWAMGRRNFELAKFFMERAAARPESASGSAEVFLELARIYAELNDEEQLESALDTYTRANAKNIEALLRAAELYQSKNLARRAETTLKAALRLDPKSNRVVNLLAQTYIDTDRTSELRPLYDAWIRANDNNPKDMILVGNAFEQQNDLENALHYYNRAARAGNNQAWLFTADIYRAQQRSTELKNALDQYLKTAPIRRIALQDALQRYLNFSTEDAIATLLELIALSPQEWPHHNTLASLYIRNNRHQEAFALLEKYIEASPNKAEALNNIARNFQSPDTVSWLLTFYHQLLEATPDDPGLLRLLGDTYLQVAYANQLSHDPRSQPMQQAEKYYLLYLENLSANATFNAGELRDFAAGMRTNNLWPMAARAYQLLLSKFPPSGSVLLHYGEALLKLGEIQQAEETFTTHFEVRGKNLADAQTISRHLLEFKRYRSAEPYLHALLNSDQQDHIQSAFSALVEMYRDTDRTREIPALINQFLEKSQNPARARRLVLTLLENSGMWSESIEQLKRMRDLRDDSVNFELGINAYRTGDSNDALDFFERFAAASPEPADAWLAIAQFYTEHAETEHARSAFDQAVSLDSRNTEALIQRGRFHILQNNIDDGIRDFQTAANTSTNPDQQAYILTQLVELLEDTGHFPHALQISREALAKNPTQRDVFLQHIAYHDLATNDPARVDAAITYLRSESIDLPLLVSLLRQHGHVEQAIQLLQHEIEVGDQDIAANTILSNAYIFIETGGIERLLSAIRPLLTPSRAPDANLLASLGQNLLYYEDTERGAGYLQAAIDLGDTQYLPMLAHTHLLLGNHQEALALFQKSLQSDLSARNNSFTILQNSLDQIALRYELAQKPAQFTDLLHVLFLQKDYALAVAPALVRETLHQENSPQAVFALLRNSPWMPADNADAIAIQITLKTLQTVASHGFLREAQSFLAELPAEVRNQSALTELATNLQALQNGDALAAPTTSPTSDENTLGNTRRQALDTNTHARLLMLHGHYEQAQKTARPQLTAADPLVARDALEVLLSIARASAQDPSIDDILKQYIDHAQDKQDARAYAAEQLTRLGYDQEATDLKVLNARQVPTETNILSAIIAAHNTGDSKTIDQLAKSYWRTAENPTSTAQRLATELRGHTETTHLASLFDPAADTIRAYPLAYLGLINREFSLGNIDAAREMLLETLQSYDFEPRLTELVLGELIQYRLFVEAARFLGPHLEDVALTRLSHRHLGTANLALNLEDDARKHFDLYIQKSSDPSYAAAEISSHLLDQIHQPHYALAQHYAEQAIATRAPEQPELPTALISRDIARLAQTSPTHNPEQPRPDLTETLPQTLTSGHPSSVTYTRLARAAFAANNPDLALTYIQKIITAPTHNVYAHYPLQRAIDLFTSTDQAQLGAQFLQQNYPRIASGNFDGLYLNITSLASLYDNAGLHQQADDLYQSAIHTELVRSPLSSDTATFLNNLAYMYSTTNTNIDRGLDMARRAIATSTNRSPYLLDTLGWLLYRDGQFNQAESLIRSALRSSNAAPYQLAEYYLHLAELLHLQSHPQQAIWLQILHDRTK